MFIIWKFYSCYLDIIKVYNKYSGASVMPDRFIITYFSTDFNAFCNKIFSRLNAAAFKLDVYIKG